MKISKKSLISQTIAEWIDSGRYVCGDRLPTEPELMAQFSVSRIVIRQAMDMLEERKLLQRRQGAGTFVLPRPVKTTTLQIAVMLPLVQGYSGAYQFILEGIEREASLRGHTVVLCNHRNDINVALDYLSRIRSLNINSGILVPMEVTDYEVVNRQLLREAEKNGMTMVLVDKIVRGGFKRCTSFVGGNGYDGIRSIVHHLAELGHRRIGCIMTRPGFGATERLKGFMDAMEEYKLDLDPSLVCSTPEDVTIAEEGRKAACHLLEMPNRPTAVVCLHDWIARNFYQEAKIRGIKIPNDISVAGFDDLPFAHELTPPLTTVRQPLDEIGRVAIEMLLEHQNGNFTGRTDYRYLATKLIVRASTAAIVPITTVRQSQKATEEKILTA